MRCRPVVTERRGAHFAAWSSVEVDKMTELQRVVGRRGGRHNDWVTELR
jgi:hypothetical protein